MLSCAFWWVFNAGINKGDKPKIPPVIENLKNPPCPANPDPSSAANFLRVNFGKFSEISGFFEFNHD